MEEHRRKFGNFLIEAIAVVVTWGIDPIFKNKRKRTVNKQFHELAVDHRFDDNVEMFRVKIFNTTIDLVRTQINLRFNGMQQIANNFSFLSPNEIMKLNDIDRGGLAQ